MTYLVAAYLTGLGILGLYAIHVGRSLRQAGRLLRQGSSEGREIRDSRQASED